MKFCSNCGNQLDDEVLFCSKCGKGVADNATPQKEVSPMERRYEIVFSKYIINHFKSPSTCKWPKFETSMVKDGLIKVAGEDEHGNTKLAAKIPPQQLRYIETYVDAQNSYGAIVRKELLIVIDKDGIPQRVLEEREIQAVGTLSLLSKALASGMNGVSYINMLKIPTWVDD